MTSDASSSSLPRICVLGSLNMDLVSYVPHHPEPGETLTSNSFAVSPGGKGANQAVACAKLSRSRPPTGSTSGDDLPPHSTGATAEVAMVGAVGADTYGTLLQSNLRAHGVDVSGVAAPSTLKTGIAIIIVDEPTGQNRIVLSPEANHLGVSPADFDRVIAPRVAVGRRPDLLIMQLEVPLPTVLLALETARRQGVSVLLNPAPAVPLPEDAYAGLAHLVVNETEASILSGLPVAKLDTEEGCAEVAGWFVGRGVGAVVITLGGRGVYFRDGNKKEEEKDGGGKEGLVPADKVREVVDTTAAGDTFVGQYALEVVSGNGGSSKFDVEAAVRKANRAAARTVERKGAQDSIPWRDELV
ncbi:Ribokinase-like protein [Cryphonectria parasitica EP155]|uniref:Ribokinase n=1 Tax=Cryphonectria parasitica (strain ATCC 38755 / EP155) TaxID=660469 RepID=A0A9P5CS39_CRYP1|nr:Ribokinase-like protein [Cryphonectria parasitica EP155]KAF3767750.1 Ribokinase-like protein [Cryphonectria parasitica EP155]